MSVTDGIIQLSPEVLLEYRGVKKTLEKEIINGLFYLLYFHAEFLINMLSTFIKIL